MRNRVQSILRMKAEKSKLQKSNRLLNASFVAGSSGSKSVKVDGFVFPLASKDDIERLEQMVRDDFAVRVQYVSKVVQVR